MVCPEELGVDEPLFRSWRIRIGAVTSPDSVYNAEYPRLQTLRPSAGSFRLKERLLMYLQWWSLTLSTCEWELLYTQKRELEYNRRVLNDLKRTWLSRRNMIWLLPPPSPPLSAPTSVISTGNKTGGLRKRANLLTWEEGGGGEETRSYDGENAWSSINYSILSEYNRRPHTRRLVSLSPLN